MMPAAKLTQLVTKATSKWAKVRKAEERSASRRASRYDYYIRRYRKSIKEAAWEIMPAAYEKASGGGKYPAHARQVMYAAREYVLKETQRPKLDDAYFTQTLLPDYMDEHGVDWDVVFDARGHLVEPHTKRTVPLGTLAVRQYLHEIATHMWDAHVSIEWGGGELALRFPTKGPTHRFGTILFIEKEGFLPLFESIDLADRYDIAIMSSKGVSSTACRRLVEDLCLDTGVPLYVLHDFDKSGFTILGMFTRDTRRYAYANPPTVIDLGLRLADVEKWGLVSEPVSYGRGSDPRPNLLENGATEEEVGFLLDARVELNAFSSPDMVKWIEGKLKKHRVKKVVPDAEVLAAAYRRSRGLQILRAKTEDLVKEITGQIEKLDVPKHLDRLVRRQLARSPSSSWDEAIGRIAADAEPASAGKGGVNVQLGDQVLERIKATTEKPAVQHGGIFGDRGPG